MEIKEFQKLVIDKAKKVGFSDCEIYYQGGESFQVLVNGGKPNILKQVHHRERLL